MDKLRKLRLLNKGVKNVLSENKWLEPKGNKGKLLKVKSKIK
jgi:hypothetical protein